MTDDEFKRLREIEITVEEQAHRITELESEMKNERRHGLISICLNAVNTCILMFGLLYEKLFEVFFNLFWINAGFLKKCIDFYQYLN